MDRKGLKTGIIAIGLLYLLVTTGCDTLDFKVEPRGADYFPIDQLPGLSFQFSEESDDLLYASRRWGSLRYLPLSTEQSNGRTVHHMEEQREGFSQHVMDFTWSDTTAYSMKRPVSFVVYNDGLIKTPFFQESFGRYRESKASFEKLVLSNTYTWNRRIILERDVGMAEVLVSHLTRTTTYRFQMTRQE